MSRLCVLFAIGLLASGAIGQDQPTTQSPEILKCIRNCPVTSEYNPVCGTNNVTYDNPGKLICAQKCGVDVTKKYDGRCSRS